VVARGHGVLFASRHPEKLDGLVQAAGNGARRGTPDEAIEFVEVILLSIPFVDLPKFGRTKRAALGCVRGKVRKALQHLKI
jgi:predicted dinucleotide-binding enzyme